MLKSSVDVPLISIVLPVYNVEKYIVRCLDSCLVQDDFDFELVFVNDCGCDGSIDLVRKYALHDKRVRVVDNPENKGTFLSRRNGAMSARGRYVFFVDPDDEISSDAISALRAEIDTYNPDIILMPVNLFPPPLFLAKQFKMPKNSNCPDLFQQIFLDIKYPWWGTPGKVYNRKLLINAYEKLSFIRERIVYSEDVLLFVICVSLAKSFRCVEKSWYRYWINPTSITMTRTLDKTSENVRNIGIVVGILRGFSGAAGFYTTNARLSLEKVTRLLEADIFFLSRFMVDSGSGRSLYLENMYKNFLLDMNWRSAIRIIVHVFSFGRIKL